MGDLRPIGSEKLTGQDKIKRIMEIARYGETEKNTENHIQTKSFIKEGKDGMTYAIVKELDGYYLKTGINESELDYIDGLRNKKKNRFKSYSAALKRMNLIFKPLNEEYNDGKADPMYEQYTTVVTKEMVMDETEEEEVDEQEKFVLNVPDEGGEEEMDMDVDMEGGEEEMDMDIEDDMGDDEMDVDMDVEDMDAEGEEPEMEGFMKPIQKLTGKLGQKLRDVEEELGSADIKYVLNSIISAVDLDNLDEEDRDDILDRFEDDETEYGDEEGGEDIDMGDEELDVDVEGEDMDMDIEGEDMGDEEEVAMESLKKRVGVLLESYVEKKSPEKYIKSRLKKNRIHKLAEKHSSTVEQELAVKKYIKENRNTSINGKNKNGSLVLTEGDKKILISKSGVVK